MIEINHCCIKLEKPSVSCVAC